MTTASTHPLGPLAGLAAQAQEWRTREAAGRATWAGLWLPDLRPQVEQLVAEHAFRLDADTIARLKRAGVLPGVRDYTPLIALLLSDEEKETCVDSTTQQLIIPSGAEDEISAPLGIPIWNQGTLEQAQITSVRHAIHLMRHLDDYHEPTLAALCRGQLRGLADADPAARAEARRAATSAFLAAPVRWRAVVEVAVHLATVRKIEDLLGQRLSGPGRTPEQLAAKITQGLATLATGSAGLANRLAQEFRARLASLTAATVVLLYEEHAYLQLTGVRDGRSVRRHLPHGLHLVFSDQTHRRADRTADLWLQASTLERTVGSYYWAREIPPAYAARKQTTSLRLPDVETVWRYIAQQEE
jgi:hypothetical protein